MATPSWSKNHPASDVRSRALTGRHLAAMRLAVSAEGVAGGLTARRAALALGVSRATAGAALRTLERAGHLHGELVGGGEIGYTPTPEGRAWLAERGVVRVEATFAAPSGPRHMTSRRIPPAARPAKARQRLPPR